MGIASKRESDQEAEYQHNKLHTDLPGVNVEECNIQVPNMGSVDKAADHKLGNPHSDSPRESKSRPTGKLLNKRRYTRGIECEHVLVSASGKSRQRCSPNNRVDARTYNRRQQHTNANSFGVYYKQRGCQGCLSWRHNVTQCPHIDTQYEEGNINIKSDRLINNTGDGRGRRCYFCFRFG